MHVQVFIPQTSILYGAATGCNHRCTAVSHLRYITFRLANLANGIFAHFSMQNHPSPFKLDGLQWCTAIFKSCHKFLIGLRPGQKKSMQ